MNYFDQVVVFGCSSSIAHLLLPELNIPQKKLFMVCRANSANCSFYKFENHETFTFVNENICAAETFSLLNIDSTKKTLILNFIGSFGKPKALRKFRESEEICSLLDNLFPFLSMIRLLMELSPHSMLVTFSGAGVGGKNLETASLGYLLGKGAMGLAVEVFGKQLETSERYVCSISPGPFPSRMQQIVAESTDEELIVNAQKAKNVRFEDKNLKKLVEMILWVSENPKEANGRIWSSVFDNPLNIDMLSEHGHLRRVTEC